MLDPITDLKNALRTAGILFATYFEYWSAEHENECPEDDTCECPMVQGINDAFNIIDNALAPGPKYDVWTLSSAMELIHDLRRALLPVGYYVGLTGSVLFKGESRNDLDVIVYPASTAALAPEALEGAIVSAGLTRLHTKDVVHARWRKLGSEDAKHVEVWQWRGRKVDLFFLS